MKLYHISETPGIKEFVPKQSLRKQKNLVWAISEEKLHNYLLPRDCPRVTFFPKPDSDPADIRRLIGLKNIKAVIAIEKKWIPIIKVTTLYKYEFNPKGFVLEDKCAGYYVSEKTQKPISVTTIYNIQDELLNYNVKLKILPSLWKIREKIIKSSLGFSIIRMQNATLPRDGLNNYFPLPKETR
jgi:hypothetical protein